MNADEMPEGAYFMVTRIEWSPDEKYVAYVVQALSTQPEFQGHKVIILDVETGLTHVVQRDGWPEYYTTVEAAIAWGSNEILYASYQNTVRAYAVDGTLTNTISLDVPTAAIITEIAVSQPHNCLAVLVATVKWPSAQALVTIDLETGQEISELCKSFEESVDLFWIGFDPTARYLVALGATSLLYWDVSRSGISSVSVLQFPSVTGTGCWSFDGHIFVVCGGKTMRVIAVNQWRELTAILVESSTWGGLTMLPNNRWAVFGRVAYSIENDVKKTICAFDPTAIKVNRKGLAAIGNATKPASEFDAQWRHDEDLASFIMFKKLELE